LATNMLKNILEETKESSKLEWQQFCLEYGLPYTVLYSVRKNRGNVSQKTAERFARHNIKKNPEMVKALISDYIGMEVTHLEVKMD